ncbi:hypothetical protein DFJ74DRAFT_653418 [Hyaloraphidium curvatum]|nr:hypothetical protein DFJ74DRAFT_653418 [Hyaloraphidium curvatum]
MSQATKFADLAQKGIALFLFGGAVWMGTEATILGYRMSQAAKERIRVEVRVPFCSLVEAKALKRTSEQQERLAKEAKENPDAAAAPAPTTNAA